MNPTPYKALFHFFLLSVIIFICYSNTFDHSWHFDDTPNIIKNRVVHIKDLSWDELKKPLRFSLGNSGEYTRPVAAFTFALNYLYSGTDTTGYHVTNLCIHIICSFFVYLVFLRTLQLLSSKGLSSSTAEGFFGAREIALLGAALWAIHPIQTQAITYIVQRQASLAAMLYMIAMYCYILFRQHHAVVFKTAFFILSLLFWTLSVFTKQNAILLPLALLGYEVAFFRDSFRGHRKVLTPLVSVLAILTLMFFWLKGAAIFEYLTYAYGHRPFTMWERLLTEPIILSRYLFLILCPISDFLILESDIIASRGLLDPPVTLLAVVFITVLVMLSLYGLRRLPVLGFALFFFFANHLVESTFIGLELYFEHRNYLPSMFIYFAVSYYLLHVCAYYRIRNRLHMYVIFLFLITAVLMSEGNATYLRNDIWKDDISLMEDAIKKSPSYFRPHCTLAVSYINLGQFDKAIELLKEAEDIYESNKEVYQEHEAALIYYNAGVLYAKNWEKTDEDKALALLLKSFSLYPYDSETHMALGALYFKRGEYENARKAIWNLITLEQDKGYVPASYYNMYGRILYQSNQLDEALKAIQKGFDVEEYLQLKFNLMGIYIKSGDMVLARSVLYDIPYDSDDELYLIYRSILLSGDDRKKSLASLADIILNNRIDYCAWVKDMKNSESNVVIIPDISSIESDLSKIYSNKIKIIKNDNMKMLDLVKKCHEFSILDL